MKKILLVLEDFAERAFLSTLLKKVGWDVEIAQSEVGLSNVVLSFSPDIVLINAFGKKIKGEFVPLKYQSSRKRPLFFLITKGRRLTEEQMEQLKIDGFFESPVDVRKLFEDLEAAGGIKASAAFQKLSQQRKHKAGAQDQNQSTSVVSKKKPVEEESVDLSTKKEASTSTPTEEAEVAPDLSGLAPENPQEAMERAREKLNKFRFSDTKRAAHNAQFIKENPLPQTDFNGIPKAFVNEQVAEFRETEDDPEIQEIDEQRKDFVKAMYELGKKIG